MWLWLYLHRFFHWTLFLKLFRYFLAVEPSFTKATKDPINDVVTDKDNIRVYSKKLLQSGG